MWSIFYIFYNQYNVTKFVIPIQITEISKFRKTILQEIQFYFLDFTLWSIWLNEIRWVNFVNLQFASKSNLIICSMSSYLLQLLFNFCLILIFLFLLYYRLSNRISIRYLLNWLWIWCPFSLWLNFLFVFLRTQWPFLGRYLIKVFILNWVSIWILLRLLL